MKNLFLTLTAVVSVFMAASIQAATYNNYSYSNGVTGTSSNYGGSTTYHNYSNGVTGTSSNYGGNTTYHNFSNGVNGTSSNYGGNTTYHYID